MKIQPGSLVSRVCFEALERGEQIVPCPLVWRGRPAFSTDDARGNAVGSNAGSGVIRGNLPWVVVHAGVGPAKLLVNWAVARLGASGDPGALPAAYVIESSASSTNGRDGDWRQELAVTQNAASGRAHVIEFDGQSWLRVGLTAAIGSEPMAFERFDLHDASDGTDDCWLILGEPLMAGSGVSPGTGWAELIHERYPGYFAAVIDETRVDDAPALGLQRLDELLATHSAARRVVFAYGGASARADSGVGAGAALDAMVTTVLGSGRLPVLARLPAGARDRAAVDALNRDIAAIERRQGLVPGADLASWFEAHPEQLGGDGRPTDEGIQAIQRLWAEALDVWYVPQ